MATHVWTIICRRAIVDQFDNSLSLIDHMEGIGVPRPPPPPADKPKALPAVPLGWYVVSYWRRSDPARPERTRARCKVLAPDGKTVFEMEQELVLDPAQNIRGLMPLPILPLRGPGVYQFVIYESAGGKAWKKVTSVPLTVEYVEPTAGAAAPAKKGTRTAAATKKRMH